MNIIKCLNPIQKAFVGPYTKYSIGISNLSFIKWSPNSMTTIHNHDGKDCSFIILNDTLHECRYTDKYIGSLYNSKTLNPYIINTIKDKDGYHQMFNFDNKIKYSLHWYYD